MISELHPKRTYKRILQIELNEISREVVDALIAQGKLPNFKRLNTQWSFLKTTSETEYKYLEPWIQWCTVHTGKTYAEHQIFHLSDVHKLTHTQIWEELSAKGIESGIIGSMNGIRRDTKGGIYFPDPWALHNDTFPDELKPLWDLIASRVQAHATSKIGVADMLKGLKICLKFGLPISLYLKIAKQLVSQKLNAKNKWKLAAVFDLFLAEIFRSVLRQTKFGFYTLFLNANAHYQHHYWRAFDGKAFDPTIKYDDINDGDDPMTYGYEMYDRILGVILDAVNNDPDTMIVVLFGLSQVPYTAQEAEGGMNYYRLNNHKDFALQVGLDDAAGVFPMMSRDWQVQYNDETARQHILSVLGGLTVNGQPLFKINESTAGFIYVETAYTRGVASNPDILDAKGVAVAKFNEVFTNIAIKSGHHTGIGNLWISEPNLAPDGTKVPLTSIYNFTVEGLTQKTLAEA